jgi:hypothetical protein
MSHALSHVSFKTMSAPMHKTNCLPITRYVKSEHGANYLVVFLKTSFKKNPIWEKYAKILRGSLSPIFIRNVCGCSLITLKK